MLNVTEKLAAFICNTQYENIPREVLEVSKLHILDTLGVLVAGSKEDGAKIIKGYIQSLGCGQESTLITQGIKTSAY